MTNALAPVFLTISKPPKRTALSFYRMLWKRKGLILLVSCISSLVTAVIVYTLPAIYRAETVILVESQRIPERFVAPTVNNDLKDRLATLSQQILSYSRLLQVIENYDLYKKERRNHTQEQVVEMMKSDVQVQLEQAWVTRGRSETRPSAFRISYQGPVPEVVAMVANQLGGLFIDENLRAREVQAVGTSEFLGTQLAEAKKRLEEQEARMSAFKLKYNGELPEQENAIINGLSQSELRLQSATDAVVRAEQQKTILEAALASAQESEQAFDELLDKAESTPLLVAGSKSAEQQTPEDAKRRLDLLRIQMGENHPDVATLKEYVNNAQKEQEAKAEAAKTGSSKPAAEESDGEEQAPAKTTPQSLRRSEVRIQRQERIQSIKAQLKLATDQIAAATAAKEKVLQDAQKMQARLSRLPLREQELAVVKRDYEISRANYQSLLDKGLSADLAAEMERRQKAERFTIVDPARVPQTPVQPNRLLLGAAGVLLSLVIGLAAGVGRELHRNTLLGEWELPKGLPVLGRIPVIIPLEQPAEPVKHRRRWIIVVAVVVVVLAGLCGAVLYFGWLPLPGGLNIHG